jgi:dolichol-phosphate mannosyltransferase
MKTAIVIPSYKVRAQIIHVVEGALAHADCVYVIDDCCPEQSGHFVQSLIKSEKLKVIFHQANAGVGAAVKTGYAQALADGCEVVIKMDGDGQMDPSFIPVFVSIIASRKADYVKGNRFYDPRTLRHMPTLRLLGNSALSLINKSVNGYWNIIDPTNGYTAINAAAISKLDLERIDNRYFFESDMLFRLGLIRAVVKDVSIPARYADEKSSLSIRKVLIEFPPKYIVRFFKRLVYQYYLRDFNIASIEIVIGLLLFWFGVIVGAVAWYKSVSTGVYASTGTVMLSVLPIILGFQLLLSAMNFDIQNVPKEPLSE